MVEKFFSVVAELADGRTNVLPVQSESSGAAFRQVRDRAGVRRVGRVTEITPDAYQRLERGEIPAANAPAPTPRPQAEPQPQRPIEPRVNHVISGPRTVIFTPRRVGGEQPFKHLVAPPERPEPPAPAPAPQPRVAPQPAARPAAQPAPQPERVSDTPSLPMPPSGDTEYRVQKSRRRDGLPYLLQRGRWQQVKDKRVFDVQWEKGFEGREQAERHLEWVRQTERELADFQQSA
jgi:hypothetical protein